MQRNSESTRRACQMFPGLYIFFTIWLSFDKYIFEHTRLEFDTVYYLDPNPHPDRLLGKFLGTKMVDVMRSWYKYYYQSLCFRSWVKS